MVMERKDGRMVREVEERVVQSDNDFLVYKEKESARKACVVTVIIIAGSFRSITYFVRYRFTTAIPTSLIHLGTTLILQYSCYHHHYNY